MGVRPLKRRKSTHTDLQLLLDSLALRAKAKVVCSANLLAFTPRPRRPYLHSPGLGPMCREEGWGYIYSASTVDFNKHDY